MKEDSNKNNKLSFIFYSVLIPILVIIVIVLSINLKTDDEKYSNNANSSNGEKNEITSDNIEISDTSFSGATFKKSFTEFKTDLNSYINQKYGDDKPINRMNISTEIEAGLKRDNYTEYIVLRFKSFRNPTLQESALGIPTVPYDTGIISICVDNNTDNIISCCYYWADTVEIDTYAEDWANILSLIDGDLRMKVVDYIHNKDNIYYSDNVCIYNTRKENQTCVMVTAADKKEVDYIKENNVWRKR